MKVDRDFENLLRATAKEFKFGFGLGFKDEKIKVDEEEDLVSKTSSE